MKAFCVLVGVCFFSSSLFAQITINPGKPNDHIRDFDFGDVRYQTKKRSSFLLQDMKGKNISD